MISAVPPRMSASGRWQKVGQGSSATSLVELRIPDQSIVDITVSFVYDDEPSSSGVANSGSWTLSTGTLYYSPADSYFGSSKLTPMGLTPPA